MPAHLDSGIARARPSDVARTKAWVNNPQWPSPKADRRHATCQMRQALRAATPQKANAEPRAAPNFRDQRVRKGLNLRPSGCEMANAHSLGRRVPRVRISRRSPKVGIFGMESGEALTHSVQRNGSHFSRRIGVLWLADVSHRNFGVLPSTRDHLTHRTNAIIVTTSCISDATSMVGSNQESSSNARL